MKKISKPLMIAAAATIVATSLGGYAWRQEHRQPLLEIYVFALKNGRSIFIRTPQDRRILIDGGANSEIVAELTKILPFYSRRIDKIIATGTEGKNVAGLIDVLERYSIDDAYLPSITLESLGISSSTDMIYSTLVDMIVDHHIPVHEVVARDRIVFDEGLGRSQLRVASEAMFPAPSGSFEYSKASFPEVAMTLSYGDTSISILGSLGKKAQKYIAGAASALLRSDALIVSHGAAPDSMSSELINILGPSNLIYSKPFAKASSQAKPKAAPKGSAKKKVPQDPFAAIVPDNRFNLKEVGTVKIVSDGKSITIGPDR